jgi:proteasome lid subunit RPN8/RPN11
MTDSFKNLVIKGIEHLFDLDKHYFKEIIIYDTVVDDIIDFAKANYPKEFVAFFHGILKEGKLIIDGLEYSEFRSNESSATPIFHFADKSFYGSVHSHPGGSNRPSRADLQFFHKIGIVNAIICTPYAKETLRFYNHQGEEIIVKIQTEQS